VGVIRRYLAGSFSAGPVASAVSVVHIVLTFAAGAYVVAFFAGMTIVGGVDLADGAFSSLAFDLVVCAALYLAGRHLYRTVLMASDRRRWTALGQVWVGLALIGLLIAITAVV
jgi:hypothetical protein